MTDFLKVIKCNIDRHHHQKFQFTDCSRNDSAHTVGQRIRPKN